MKKAARVAGGFVFVWALLHWPSWGLLLLGLAISTYGFWPEPAVEP